uniref:Si:ch211-158m24.12 n=1 Tax=Seriola lalandi dorsalis TaxID=1841481 RepID=A0A3B4WDX6_SERLL
MDLPEFGHFLELLLATLHGEVLSLIQTMLQVLDCDLQVLLHPLQHHPPHPESAQGQPPASSWCSEDWCSECLRQVMF